MGFYQKLWDRETLGPFLFGPVPRGQEAVDAGFCVQRVDIAEFERPKGGYCLFGRLKVWKSVGFCVQRVDIAEFERPKGGNCLFGRVGSLMKGWCATLSYF